MPTLDWMGKDKVVNHHRDVPYRVLEHVPENGVLDSHGTDCGNMIVHGDNLEALKALLPEYEGRVDCIYIDPPYNTGNENWVYNDNVNDPRIRKWLGKVVGKEGEDFSRHDKWLCMMYPRLQLLRKMLKDTGVIFISIGDDECAALKYICDEIFGTGCFQGDISWQRAYGSQNDKHGMPVEVEHLVVYSIGADWKPSALDRTERMDSKYKNPDGDFAPWRPDNIYASGAFDHQGMVYAIQHPFTGELLYPSSGSHWRHGQAKMLEVMNQWCPYELRELDDRPTREEICTVPLKDKYLHTPAIVLSLPLDKSREIATRRLSEGAWPLYYFSSDGTGGMQRKTYLTAVEGKLPTNLWLYDDVGHTDEASKELKAMFDGKAVFQNPKPTRLIRRILQIACPEDGLVLDSFAGSGTTAQAVLHENAFNNAARRFILVEMGDYASSTTAERVRRTISGYTMDKAHKDRLYEKKLTYSNLKKCSEFYAEALAVKNAVPEGKYDKVEGPKMAGSAIVVEGVTNKGETVPGIDSGFSYYELGPALFKGDGSLNANVSATDVMRYVWYTETKAPYEDLTGECPYLMGEIAGTVYYLAYETGEESVLGYELLGRLPRRGQATVVYADRCVLDEATLEALGVRFKQIPRQIARM